MKKTLYGKLWDDHLIHQAEDGSSLIYIDRQLIHEVTSPQAFEGLRMAGRKVWRISANLASPDHNVPTMNRQYIADPDSRAQLMALDSNCNEFGIEEFKLDDIRQGILHVMSPEQGASLPGMTIVCGDSHTSTHGALGCLAFGIGTSEVEHVLATQSLWLQKAKTMRVSFEGVLQKGVEAKDLALYLIGQIGTAGGTGHVIEFAGSVVRLMSMEGRMTLCNMAIEAGARSGMVAVDEATLNYIKGRPYAPKADLWEAACYDWLQFRSDEGAVFDQDIQIDVTRIEPQVTWGTSPEMVLPISGRIPDPARQQDPVRQAAYERALYYMGLEAGTALADVMVDRVFIGSCTNSRIEDLRSAALQIRGGKVASTVKEALVVPGSGLVKAQAEQEGLDQLFMDAGFQWREPGCSMCLGMNADQLLPGERCASTSNRNFEGRQGAGGRTHLVSPAMAVAAAIAGHFVDIRE